MAKDPAFLFYPGDFNTGTQFFTDEQVGKYMRLLMAQHQHGHLSDDQVIYICKSYDNHIMSKFKKDSEGKWFNERLEIEKKKREAYVRSRGKNKEGKTHISKSHDSHVDNENENVIESIIEIGVKSENSVSVRSKYAGEKTRRIYDLTEYFKLQGNLDAIDRAGWTSRFTAFMADNPGKVFDDDNHLYNTLKNFKLNGKVKAFEL